MNHSHSQEGGATVVLVAISLLMLLGMTALAIDGGLGYDDRRGTVNAADNAALAAAWEACNPSGVGPEVAALDTATSNGYDNSEDNVTVTPTDLGDGQWQVTISVEKDGVFGQATPYAGDTLTVVSEAVALCDPTAFLDGQAIFARATGCPTNELDLSGSSIKVDGGIHSNEDLTISGSHVDLSGPVTYRGSGPAYGEHDPGPPHEYPIDVEIGEYAPAGTRAANAGAAGEYFSTAQPINNSWLVDEGHAEDLGGNTIRITQSGIYYTSNSGNNAIRLQDVSTAPGVRVTFASPGQIDLRGPDLADLHGYDPIVSGGTVSMLFFSNYPGTPSCNPSHDAVKFQNANFVNAKGVIFAPNGGIQISASTIDLEGSLIAFTVKTSGSDLDITYVNDPAFEPEYRVELLR